jgi:hypothetical protein
VYDDTGSVTGNIVSGGVTDDRRPQINGTAEANSVVTVYIDGYVSGSTTANTSGAWSFTPSADLAEGSHRFAASAMDAAGNTSAQAPAWTVVVDTVATSPIITSVYDDVNAITGNIASGGRTNDARPTINGTAEANSVVTVYIDGYMSGSTTTSASGAWSFTPSTNLSEGAHSLTAAAKDAVGNTSAQTPAWTVIVDTVAPDAPVITSIYDDAGSITGNIANGGVTDDRHPQVNGTAEVNSVVTVYLDGQVAGSTTASATGVWSFTPTLDLAEGSHRFTATATDATGNTSAQTAAWNITINTFVAAPVITSVYDDVNAVTGNIANGGLTNDARPTINGSAVANSTVRVYIDGMVAGSTTASATGSWAFTPSYNLSEGAHSFTAMTTSSGTDSSQSAAWNVTVDTVAPYAPIITSVMDDVGTVTGNIPNGGTTSDDRRPTINGTAEANTTVNVIIDGTVAGSTVVSANGTWSLTPSYDLSDGQHVITAIAGDRAYNLSEMSSPWNINVTPATPVLVPLSITSIYDDVGTSTGYIANGGTTDDSRPTVNGTGPANTSITIFMNAQAVGNVVTDSSGVWHYTPSGNLADGSYVFSSAVVSGGQISQSSGNWGIIVATATQPSNPVTSNEINEDFESVSQMDLTPVMTAGFPTLDTKYFTVRSSDVQQHHGPAALDTGVFNVQSGVKTPTLGNALTIEGQQGIWIELKNGVTATSFSAKIGDLRATTNNSALMEINFYSADGKWVGQNLISSFSAYDGYSTVNLTSTSPFTKVRVNFRAQWDNDGWAWLDDIKISGLNTSVTSAFSAEVADFVTPNETPFIMLDQPVIDTTMPLSTNLTEQPDIIKESFLAIPEKSSIESEQLAEEVVQDLKGMVITENNILQVTKDNQSVHFTDVNNSQKLNEVNLSDYGKNVLHINSEEILVHGEKDLFLNDGHIQMMVKGDKGDIIDLDNLMGDSSHSQWSMQEAMSIEGEQYQVWQDSNNNVEILVQYGVEVDLQNR